MIRSISLLRIQKEWILPAVTRDSFNTYISFLTRLLIFTAIFEPESWIKRSILCVLSVVKSQYKQDLHCSRYKEKNFDTTLLAPLARLDFNLQYNHILHVYFKTRVHLACLKHYPKANRPECNERTANLRPCQQPCYSFSSFYGNEWKITPFWILTFLFSTKNPSNDLDFWSDLGF